MIVFIAPYPSEDNQKDGMIQRIASIDALVATDERVYLDISLRRHWKLAHRTEGAVSIYRLNAFRHFGLIRALMRRSCALYMHSIFNAMKVLPFLSSTRSILDAHGIVPEELKQEGRPLAAWMFGVVERIAVRRSSVLVCVTDSMRQHFNRKHGRDSPSDLVIPILPLLSEARDANAAAAATSRRPGNAVIYTGGLQAWQNVDKMLDAAAKKPALRYTFLTGDHAKLQDRLAEHGVRDYVCRSVRPDQVKDYYLGNSLGFILREPIAVNAVACPTKLIEYLFWGVIPIVITPSIGDFNEANISTITLEEFLAGRLPGAEAADAMRRRNRATIDALIEATNANKSALQRLLRSGGSSRGEAADRGAHA